MPGTDEEGVGAGLFAEDGDLFGGADHAVDAGGLGEFGEAEDLIGGGGGDADAGEFVRVHAGEDGDGEEARGAGGSWRLRLRRTSWRRRRGVDGEEGGSGLRGGADGSGDGVGDVVEFEVEEDVEAAVAELLRRCWLPAA